MELRTSSIQTVCPASGCRSLTGRYDMNIIICDDDEAQVAQIERFLSSRCGYTIFSFHSGEEVLHNCPQTCDIAILDIQLQDTLGTKLAEKLRKLYPEIDIILISSFPQYVTNAFHIKVSQFLIKPINQKTFLSEFDHILAERGSRHFRWIVSNKTSIYSLYPSEILYVEAYHRHLFIHTAKQKITVCGRLKDICEKLERYGFILCHQGFLVNSQYIERIESDTIILDNGERVPISSRKRRMFIERYTRIITQNPVK